MKNKNLIISHKSDIDGLGSPILAKLIDININVILIEPIELFNTLSKLNSSLYETIYITDLPIDEMAAKYIDKNKNLMVKIKHFDHHESEQNVGYSFINEVIEIDGKKESATSLFYRYLINLYPDNLILNNKLLKYFVEAVKINDTSEADWLSKSTSSYFLVGRKLTILLFLIGRDAFIEKFYNLFVNQGKTLFTKEEEKKIKNQEAYISKHIKKCDNALIKVEIDKRPVGVVVTSEFRSEVGNELSKRHPELAYILIVDNNRKSFSFRTTRQDVNVFEIARTLCSTGGGHPRAAGMPFCKETEWLLEEVEKYKH